MNIQNCQEVRFWRNRHLALSAINFVISLGSVIVIEGLPNYLSDSVIVNVLLTIDIVGSLGLGFFTCVLAIEYNRELSPQKTS